MSFYIGHLVMILVYYIFSNVSMVLLMLIVSAQSRVDNVYRAGMAGIPVYRGQESWPLAFV